MLTKIPHFINGQAVSSTGDILDVYQPVTGKKSGQITVADQACVDKAIMAAVSASTRWSLTTPLERVSILSRYQRLLEQEIEHLAKIITQEHGKTVNEAIGSVQRGIDVLSFACGIPTHLKGNFTEDVSSGIDAYSLRQSLGVCVGITPFNFPGMIPLWMLSMAIACGNTFVLKPSEKNPSCAIRLAELAKEAGLPDGVLNVVQGDKTTVDVLVTHPEVKAVSFVGSSPVAESVYKTAIANNKRAQAFGGAKNHCLIMPDVDIESTAKAIVTSAFGSAGERCMAISVVLVLGDSLAEALIKRLIPLIQQLKVGPGTDTDTDIGPLISQAHWERVKSYVEIGKQEGAALLLDGSEYKPDHYQDGFFMGPCLFDHVKPHMKIYREEIFGPVLCIVRIPDIGTALNLINQHDYGNGASIFTRDAYTARTFSKKVEAGMVGVNIAIPVPVAYHSFGGWKKSVFADIGMFGEEAIRFYTKLKTVTQRFLAEK
jgi:malonate-semialdehyde dehydrogenase (acetylating)/methylmalonate-semialdehyde dehydrogenase